MNRASSVRLDTSLIWAAPNTGHKRASVSAIPSCCRTAPGLTLHREAAQFDLLQLACTWHWHRLWPPNPAKRARKNTWPSFSNRCDEGLEALEARRFCRIALLSSVFAPSSVGRSADLDDPATRAGTSRHRLLQRRLDRRRSPPPGDAARDQQIDRFALARRCPPAAIGADGPRRSRAPRARGRGSSFR